MPETSPPAPRADRTRQRRRRRGGSWWRSLVEFAAALTVLALVQAFVIKAYQIPSASMEQTLMTGDRILVNRLDPHVGRGDIVVFEHGDTWQSSRRSPSNNPGVNVLRLIGSIIGLGPSTKANTVKRIIATGGQKVACCDEAGNITIDGVALQEDYLGSNLHFEPGVEDCTTERRSFRCFPQITVPYGSFFLLGDNRSNSADSIAACRGQTNGDRCARFVREDQVVGPVVARFWPPSQIGGVGD